MQNKKNVCNYRVELSSIYEPKIERNIFVGINPKLAEELVNHANYMTTLQSLSSCQKIQFKPLERLKVSC